MAKKSTPQSPARKDPTPARTRGSDDSPAPRPSRFDPFAPSHLADWFDRWPEVFSRRWPESFQAMTSPFAEQGFRMEQFVDDAGTLVVRGELPGLDPDEDVTIVVEGDRLKISGSREERSEETTDGTFRSEFHYGSFARSVPLPTGARTDDITADYTNGILEVRIPIDEKRAAVTTIPIASSG